MDRVRQVQLGVIGIALAASVTAFADTVLAPVYKAVEPGPGEIYPDSRFGMPPAKIETGVTPHYASRAAKDIDEVSDDEIAHADEASRAPAGMVFGKDAAKAKDWKAAPKQSGDIRIASKKTDNTGVVVSQASTLSMENAAIVRKGVQEVSVIAGDLGYFPKTIFVTRDVPVRLFVTGASKNTLCIMMDSFQVRKQVRSQKIEEITFTPNIPGKYRFYCPVNGMEGSMIVKELTTTIAAGEDSASPNPNTKRAPSSTGE